ADAPAQHLRGRVAAEIDATERAGDIHLLRGFDRQSKYRHEIAQGCELGFAEAPSPACREIGIETVHLAERAGIAEAMDEGNKVPMALVEEVADHRKIPRSAVGEIQM